jgi:DNA-binding transcriptional LysR family regulator
MELDQLRYFVTIAECGGFRRAAEQLGVAQPILTQHIKALETELAATLFERGQRPVRVTEVGRALLAEAALILAEVRNAREELDEFADLEGGHVRVGTLSGHGAPWTINVLGAFHRRHPKVAIELVEHTSEHLLALLTARQIDVAWLNLPERASEPPPGVVCKAIGSLQLAFAVQPGHRLADSGAASLDELAAEPLIVPPDSTPKLILERAFLKHGLVPRVTLWVVDTRLRLELAAQGLGIALTTTGGLRHHNDLALTPVHVRDESLIGSAVVAWAEPAIRKRAVAVLVQLARETGRRTSVRDRG